jgi:hypothetical protein
VRKNGAASQMEQKKKLGEHGRKSVYRRIGKEPWPDLSNQ